ncbi:MAG: FkbM family methyltransferase [Leptospiraceae bacterium]|nr:FkbM family methyltransferase [Leptospiraceae bacterium]NUM41074.1 FkbM family methyltransferase [Leptospiraceae bacterium]
MNRLGLIKKIMLKILRKFRLKLFKIGPYSIFDFESFLYRHLEVHKTLTFIQIGANDGIMNDPIYQFNIENKDVVSGFVIEPLPDIFEKLVKNYKRCPNILPFNLAIHQSKKEATLYRVKPEYENKVSDFAKGIASFNSSHWKKTTLIPNDDYMEEIKVSCVSFFEFIKANSIKNLDLLLLDTEGYDYEILMSIDFNKIKPKIIRFEHGIRNQVMSKTQFIQLCKHLNKHGYQIIGESYDATAYLLDSDSLIF